MPRSKTNNYPNVVVVRVNNKTLGALQREAETSAMTKGETLRRILENRYGTLLNNPKLSRNKLIEVADRMSGGTVDVRDYLAVLRLLDKETLTEIFTNSTFLVDENGIVRGT